MDKKRYGPDGDEKKNDISRVVKTEAVNLYPDCETDEGMLPRSKPESRAGLDCDMNEGRKKQKKT
ncbi:MAG: hypothetical protein IJF69_04080 [Clostridia bacterium]|nr:hypothetical protein [Clostridia bacterium]